jgi:DNA-binding transcriptional ArsR family regulator
MLDVVRLGRALGCPTRVFILAALGSRPASVSDLAKRTGLPHALVSYHLGVLHEVSVIDVEPVGRRRIYRRIPTGFECLVRPLPSVA